MKRRRRVVGLRPAAEREEANLVGMTVATGYACGCRPRELAPPRSWPTRVSDARPPTPATERLLAPVPLSAPLRLTESGTGFSEVGLVVSADSGGSSSRCRSSKEGRFGLVFGAVSKKSGGSAELGAPPRKEVCHDAEE